MEVQIKKSKKSKGGKKNRKYGRWGRAPAMKHYVAAGRCQINAEKRRIRHLKRMKKQRDKVAKRAV